MNTDGLILVNDMQTPALKKSSFHYLVENDAQCSQRMKNQFYDFYDF